MKTKIICFDLDGTLIDSAHDICQSVHKTLAFFNLPSWPDSHIRKKIGGGLRNLIRGVFEGSEERSAAIETKFIEIYAREKFNTTHLFPGTFDTLKKWNGPIALITNKPEVPARELLKELGLMELDWSHIVGADTYPERKPSPLALKNILSDLNLRPDEAVMVGDGIPDMMSAQAAGVPAIAVQYGYSSTAELLVYNPAAFLENITDLIDVIHKIK